MRLPQEIPADGCAYCMVFYGCGTEYLLLALVVARRLARLGVKRPLILLPTKDVPDSFRGALEKAGCLVQKPVEYLLMHPALLRSPQGRHCKVLTKLLCLGLKISKLRKLLLIDADILPRQSLDSLFMYNAPAAKLMQANLEYRPACRPLREGDKVPAWRLDVNEDGIGDRFNAGVVLLEPDPDLLDHLVKEAHPERILVQSVGTMAPSEETQEQQWVVVQDIFGTPWQSSWTPEEDLLTRAMKKLRPRKKWTHIGAGKNFEVKSDYLENPLEHGDFCCDAFHKISVLHFWLLQAHLVGLVRCPREDDRGAGGGGAPEAAQAGRPQGHHGPGHGRMAEGFRGPGGVRQEGVVPGHPQAGRLELSQAN